MAERTIQDFKTTLDALLDSNPHAKNKGDVFKDWCLECFGVEARISHIREQRQTTNRVSEQYRYFAPVVIFVVDDVVKRDVLVQYISDRSYRQLECVAIIGVTPGVEDAEKYVYAFEQLLVYKDSDFAEWAKPFFQQCVSMNAPSCNFAHLDNLNCLQIIYYGAPGTGKSHTTDGVIADFPDSHQRTTFHPDTDYSSFVGCYKPTKDDDGKLTYKFVPQVFLKAYVEAWRNPALPYFLVIEEINRGNCAQIFGDIFQLLDRDKDNGGISKYTITPDEDIRKYLEETFADDDFEHLPELLRLGERMQLPGTLYILATMNTSDQSLFPIDSAFKRRWAWKYKPIEPGVDDKGNEIKWQIRNGKYAYDWWEFISKINEKIEDATQSEDKKMGFWFTSPENGVGYITLEDFISKVLFYLWNDVYKDLAKTDETIFKGKPEKAEGASDEPKPYEIFFTHFFRTDGSVENRVRDFMRFNGITENVFVEPAPKGDDAENGDDTDDEDGGGDPSEFLKYWQNFRELLLTMPIGERIANYKTPTKSAYQVALPNDAGLTNTFVLARIAPKQNYCRMSVGINGEVQTDILSYLYDQKDAIVAKVQELTGEAPEWYESELNHIYVNVQRDGLHPEWQAECVQKLFDYFVEILKGFTPQCSNTNRGKGEKLKITLPNGIIIEEKTVVGTYVAFFEQFNPDQIAALGIKMFGMPVLSKTKQETDYPQKQLTNGWWVLCGNKASEFKRKIDSIAKGLHLDINAEVIPK